MGIRTEYVCDGCGESCDHRIVIRDMEILAANGRRRFRSMGFARKEGSGVVCSVECFRTLIEKILDRDPYECGDLFVPGEQVGVDCVDGSKVGK